MKQKLKIGIATILALLMLLSTIMVFAGNEALFEGYRVVNILVNGKSITGDVPAISFNGRTMVPIRFIAEALGAEVTWDQDTFTAKIETQDTQQRAQENTAPTSESAGGVRKLTRTITGNKDNIIELDGKVDVEIISLISSKGEFLPTKFEVKNDGGNTKILIGEIPNFSRNEKYSVKILSKDKDEFNISLNFVEGVTFVGGNYYKIAANPSKGFNYDYYIYVPKNYKQNQNSFLLVESNNTGTVSNDMKKHEEQVIWNMANYGLGRNVSESLNIPFLMPVFIRPQTRWNDYTHDLDRDTMLAKLTTKEKEELGNYERIDLQLVKMIEDAQEKLRKNELKINDKILMVGFSASAKFANKFSLLHPEKIQALAIGGINAATMLPVETYKNTSLRYPLGIADYETIAGKKFNYDAYKEIKQFFYMGALDDNDVTQFRDGWDEVDAKTWWNLFGEKMMPTRWDNLQDAYSNMGVSIQMHTYSDIGHMTNGTTNNDTINFLKANLGSTFNKITPKASGR